MKKASELVNANRERIKNAQLMLFEKALEKWEKEHEEKMFYCHPSFSVNIWYDCLLEETIDSLKADGWEVSPIIDRRITLCQAMKSEQ